MKSTQLKTTVEKSLSDSKAIDIVTIDLKGKSDIADYMIVATGTSSRHVASMADTIVQLVKDKGYKGVTPEGTETAEWVLVDLFDVIVHIFQPEARSKYELEKMWQIPADSKDKRVAKKAKAAAKAKDKAKKAPAKSKAKAPAKARAKAPAKRLPRKTAK